MRYWIYVEPASAASSEPIYTIMSDAAVLAEYWEYWQNKMRAVGKHNLNGELNRDKCIQDWVTTRWAQEVTRKNLLRIIDER